MALNIPIKSPGDTAFASETNEIVAAIVVLEENIPLINVTHINELADFPDPVAGVIELVQTPGESRTYVLGAVNVNVASNRFTITDGNIVIIGSHRTESTITSTTAGNLFTCVDAAFFPEKIGFHCVNAKVVKFTVPTALTFKSFVCDNIIIRSCDTVFDIDGAFTTSFRTLTVVSATTNGIIWTGTGGSQFNMTNSLGLSWGGTLFDLGTAKFDIINIGSGNRFVSPVGTTILSGAANSANLNAAGRATVEGVLFNGLGTALSGIDTMDLKWEFNKNNFVDGTTLNTRELVDGFLTASRTVTIGGGNQGVYFPVAGTNWDSDINDRFTVSSAGVIEYIGLNNIESEIQIISTVEKDGGGTDKICGKIAIDTGSGFIVQDKTMACTENATPTGITAIGLFTLSTGDKIQSFVANDGGISDVIVSGSTVIIKGG